MAHQAIGFQRDTDEDRSQIDPVGILIACAGESYRIFSEEGIELLGQLWLSVPRIHSFFSDCYNIYLVFCQDPKGSGKVFQKRSGSQNRNRRLGLSEDGICF
jgi:hypothetical protein